MDTELYLKFLHNLPAIYSISFFAFLGMVFASFASCIAYRSPRGLNWWSERSKCPKCHTKLGFCDLLPIISWAILRGKCRYCKAKFGKRYIIAEILLGAVFAYIFYEFGLNFETIIFAGLAFLLTILFLEDFDLYIIEDWVNIAIFSLGLLYKIYFNFSVIEIILPIFCYFLCAIFLRMAIFLWKKQEGLGMGDVKFFIATGAFLDISSMMLFLFFAGFFGILIAIFQGVMKKGGIIPFGPALGASLFICLLFKEKLAIFHLPLYN